MKKMFPLLIASCLLASAAPVMAQSMPGSDMANKAVQEMQSSDPQAAQKFSSALQQGDIDGAKKIYLEFKRKQGDRAQSPDLVSQATSTQAPAPAAAPSIFEQTLSGHFPERAPSDLQQFGYDLFNKTVASFVPTAAMPVGPDYLIGPGDQLTLTLWGTTEGLYTLTVTREGNITLPKVGVVPVAGLRFGELEKTLKRHLSKYYSNFNLSVAMGNLKTISVYVVGEVANPGNYTLSSLTMVYGALFAAGGPTKKGTLRAVQVLRAGKVVRTIDLYDLLLRGDRSQDVRLQSEDTVFVPLIGPIAGVSGMVYRPAIYELKGAETIGDVLQLAGGAMPISFGNRVQLNRFTNNTKQVVLDIKLSSVDISAVKQVPELREPIRNMDTITVFPIYDKVWESVTLTGEVDQPGPYQWTPGLRVRDIISLGRLRPTADLKRAEIVRLSEDFKDRKILAVNLQALDAGDQSQNILLQPQDYIHVYSAFRKSEKVRIDGEVLSPGVYEITSGERLSDLIRRIGGFTAEAYPYGTNFKRRDVKSAESRNLQLFISRMQQQIGQQAATGAATSISAEEAAFTKAQFSMNQSLLASMKALQEQFEGRVSINITQDISSWAGTKNDLLLQDGDDILVPKKPQEVMVLGEVHSPSAHIYLPGLTVSDYVNQSGGKTDYANEDQLYVLQANGMAVSSQSPGVGNILKKNLEPGDTVFMPQQVERYATMRNTRDIVDILFKTAV
ncbi:MAG: polysaccharide export protein, partial [Nitrospirae bacterium]|nr:polysaccharide export protein [Nitrospirota bacterium]